MAHRQVQDDIPGTVLFDGRMARLGYALNKMCFSFNEAANRAAFLQDEDAYCASYGLNAQQREAIRNRNVLQLLAAGHSVERNALLGLAVVLLLYLIIGGRAYCSWVCPVNVITDAAAWLRRRIGIKGSAHISRKIGRAHV